MIVISVLNQKGGSGKTTIATHLARGLQLCGNDVLLIDSDPQGSARDWASIREEQPLPVAGLDRPTIDRDLKKIAKVDFVVIDGAPQAKDLAVSAIKASNFILIPVTPSPYDLWATKNLVDLVCQRIELIGGLKAAFVISRMVKNTKLGAGIENALAEYGLPIFRSRIHHRTVYPTSAGQGSTVLDVESKGEAAKEVRELVKEVLEYI
jgi:chromosome partitioning protein